jgi:ubiquinone/menaquinone biosynthesis C-methylase UbiE
MRDIAEERQKVVPHATGTVLEIGIGPGLNLQFYDAGRVAKVIGVDPQAGFLSLGEKRYRSSPVPLEIVEAPAEDLPLDGKSIDTAVITYTLCSVDDPLRALGEVRRVLKPDGRVLFLEHGLSHDASVAKWQNRLNPMWRRLAVGCNLNRPVEGLIKAAGFRIGSIEHYYMPRAPRPLAYLARGEAMAA